MTNDLKNFLEEENKAFSSFNRFLVEPWVVEHDKRIIKKVLDLVEQEVGNKKRTINNLMLNDLRDIEYNKALEDISTIINNLRV